MAMTGEAIDDRWFAAKIGELRQTSFEPENEPPLWLLREVKKAARSGVLVFIGLEQLVELVRDTVPCISTLGMELIGILYPHRDVPQLNLAALDVPRTMPSRWPGQGYTNWPHTKEKAQICRWQFAEQIRQCATASRKRRGEEDDLLRSLILASNAFRVRDSQAWAHTAHWIRVVSPDDFAELLFVDDTHLRQKLILLLGQVGADLRVDAT